MRRIFRKENYGILTAGSGREALELLAAQTVHVVISDHRMPGMTGPAWAGEAGLPPEEEDPPALVVDHLLVVDQGAAELGHMLEHGHVVGLSLGRMGEEDIDLFLLEDRKRDLLDGEQDRTGRQVFVDPGPLGELTQEEARSLVLNAVTEWNGVRTSALRVRLVRGGGTRAWGTRAERGSGSGRGHPVVEPAREAGAVRHGSSRRQASRRAARARDRCVFTVFSGIPRIAATCSTDRSS